MKKKPHSRMPEPIGIFPCRLPANHRGPCSYKGFFTSYSGIRVVMDVAWTSTKQVAQKKKDEEDRARFFAELELYGKKGKELP